MFIDKMTVKYEKTIFTIFLKSSLTFLGTKCVTVTEGVQLMVVGDKFKFFIPANLGYGNSSSGKITAGSLIVIEVTLLAIQ